MKESPRHQLILFYLIENEGEWKRIRSSPHGFDTYKPKQNTISTSFAPFTIASLEQVKKIFGCNVSLLIIC